MENNDGPTADKIDQKLLAPFLQVMDTHKGLTLDALLNSLEKELKAKKTDTFKATTKSFDEEGHISSQTEEVIYSKPLVDWQTRQKARKDALAYRGVIAAEKHELTGKDGNPIEITAGPGVIAAIDRITTALCGGPAPTPEMEGSE